MMEGGLMKIFTKGSRRVSSFSFALGFALFSVFLFPILACWVLAWDGNVTFWFGRYMFWWTLPIPFCFVAVILRQMTHDRPRRPLVMGTWICPSIVIFVVAGIMNSQASHLADRLLSRDCHSFPTIRPLAVAYNSAKAHLQDCIKNQTNPAGRVVLQSCPMYREWYYEADNPRLWDYLHYLEENFDCSGFCSPMSRGVWSFGMDRAPKDSCARAVVAVMKSKVRRLTTQLMAVPMIIIAGVIIWVYTVRPTFQAHFPSDEDKQPWYKSIGASGWRPRMPHFSGGFHSGRAASQAPPLAMPPPPPPGPGAQGAAGATMVPGGAYGAAGATMVPGGVPRSQSGAGVAQI